MEFDGEQFAIALLHNMSDAVVYADSQGVIGFWNAGAVRIFGFTAAEALGQSLDIIIPVNLRERHWEGFRTTMRTGQSRYGAGDLLSVPAMRKDGTRISVEFTIVPFRATDGTMEGIAALLRDVTARFNELRTLRRELQERSRGTGPSDTASRG
jgi:PAS domain S-box-containing protein